MIITRKTFSLPNYTDPVGVSLVSDFHLGAALCNTDAIRRDLDEAKAQGDRIAIGGDVFDAILPKDIRRFDPSVLAPELQGRSDVLNAALDLAEAVLLPYVDSIDMIGDGNHEGAVEKHHSVSLVPLLIERLQSQSSKGHVISYGGIEGFLDYRWRSSKNRNSNGRRLVIYWHHGAGGSAPVSKGMIDFARKGVWVDGADVVWMGHKHNRIADTGTLRVRCPLQGDEPSYSKRLSVMTGSYLERPCQTSEDALRRGRVKSYAQEFGMAPQAMGGARVLAYPHRKSGWSDIRVLH